MEIIAEIGQYHDGSADRLFKLVENLCETEVDTIKLQHHIASAESSQHERFRVQFSKKYSSRYDYWAAMEIGIENLAKIKEFCEARGKSFLCTPFSLQAADELASIGVDRFKLGSADIDNHLLLERIASFKRPVIISNGLRQYGALARALQILTPCGSLTVMHCTTSYPTVLTDVNWGEINKLKALYPETDIGLSDHSGEIWPAVFALSSNLDALEIHVAYSKLDFGPDTTSSITFDQLEQIFLARRAWSSINENLAPKTQESLIATSEIFSRSVKLRQSVKAGSTVSNDVLETFKPAGLGVDPAWAFQRLGKKFLRDIKAGEVLQEGDIE